MTQRLKEDMYACGRDGLPHELTVGEVQYRHIRTFKHDFFAATGYYEPAPDQAAEQHENTQPVVLKINRKQSFCGIPLSWLGRGLQKHELEILRHLQDFGHVPKLIGSWKQNGFLYEYIEGRSLDEKPEVPDTFFDDLETLLDQIHQKNICYLDFNKRGNILVGKDGRPHLIDFQISLRSKKRGWLCRLLQQEDRYHLLKHKRHFRPDLMSQAELEKSRCKSFWIRIHRTVAEPYRFLRRGLMRWLYKHQVLHTDSDSCRSPENDPQRFDRKQKS